MPGARSNRCRCEHPQLLLTMKLPSRLTLLLTSELFGGDSPFVVGFCGLKKSGAKARREVRLKVTEHILICERLMHSLFENQILECIASILLIEYQVYSVLLDAHMDDGHTISIA